ncbi:hypothetical protein M141_1386 [Bacteroides fragilis str. S38L5]|nr:hypothetical protein M114_1318 [Bacteroides fragilis str. 3986 N(B)22]EYA96610.1 hypothetical protein M141_1386 [Bacteroides fragilis str. S38L5]EYB05907.1 hypothetical protein M129_1322 [Bacteroides fragilis str. S6R5]
MQEKAVVQKFFHRNFLIPCRLRNTTCAFSPFYLSLIHNDKERFEPDGPDLFAF